jgi:DNA gyrase subunit A
MAKKKSDNKTKAKKINENAVIIGSGEIVEQQITDTLRENYMPYAMSVIVSRAIPEIDGFKPSHRKLLYTMYKLGLLGSTRTKSANIVGATMKLNPHGDMAIYETMVRLSRGHEALLHPYVDSKGNFGKFYSRDMAFAASRYTEAKLDKLSSELFNDIDKDTVDFVDNYDATMKEPTLFPVTFPTILVNSNTGIAVSMASNICSFNLKEVCETTIAYIRDEDCDVSETLLAPDFSGGGCLIYDKTALDNIYNTGRGSIKIRARYNYDKSNNCIEITEIPPTTTIEAIIEKVIDVVKTGKIKEITDIRDESDLDGLKIAIDLKRGASAEIDKIMAKLFKMTPLEDSFSANFNILVKGNPKVMGVKEIIKEWLSFRMESVRRRTAFELKKREERLHLLKGLKKILLDIDKAIKIVRETEEEKEVIPNLMIGFGIDEIQAEYVAEIKLRNLNREYILKRTNEIEKLEQDIDELNGVLSSKAKIKGIIISELKEVIKKYGKDRKTEIIYVGEEEDISIEPEIPDYAVHLFFTRDGYFKKVTPQSLRMSGEHKLKEGDEISQTCEANNKDELLFFTNQGQVYKSRVSDFDVTKISLLGDYVPQRLEMQPDESPIYMAVTNDYKGFMVFFFENGKVAKVAMQSYETKTNRKKLINAYSTKSKVVKAQYIKEDAEFLMTASNRRVLLFNTAAILSKTTKDTQGVSVMTQKKGHRVISVKPYNEGDLSKPHRYRTRTLPAAGAIFNEEEKGDQLTL